jgi:hypothetical protein
MTPGERSAQIDHELDASLGVFDGRMRDEQATLAGQRSGRGGSAGNAEGQGSGSDGTTSGEGPGQNGAGTNGDKGGTTGSGTNPNGKGAGSQGNGPNGNGNSQGQPNGGNGDRGGGGGVGGGGARGGSGPNTVPADVPDGSDDDIVARQLREAAMKETDPELREKLWQEYRNYKKGAS